MFSPDSRWDRHLPGESHSNEEALEVGVIFRKGKIIPKWFVRNTTRHPIKEVTYEWADKRGGEILYFFAVSDGQALYQIYFNTTQLNWRLHLSPESI